MPVCVIECLHICVIVMQNAERSYCTAASLDLAEQIRVALIIICLLKCLCL